MSILLFALPLGWLRDARIRGLEREKVIAGVEQAGGIVQYDFQFDRRTESFNPGAACPVPGWLRWVVGNQFFIRPIRITILNSNFDDASLRALTILDSIESLSLSNTRVSDSGLVYLEAFPRLRKLDLSQTAITDSGLSFIERLHEMESLSLAGTGITDLGLLHLREQSNLNCIFLADTRVTEHGVKQLQESLPQATVFVKRLFCDSVLK
ncbi:MAG: hypothetical protein ACLQNE_34140 [Thermoguttaceae bacterium]